MKEFWNNSKGDRERERGILQREKREGGAKGTKKKVGDDEIVWAAF